ncbi:MAG: hypothetical protein GY722_28340 [bacterium]|nr:hypothetical protein [bacterium]
MKKIIIACALLALLSVPAFANETVNSGPLIMYTTEDYDDADDGREMLHGSMFNPSGIVIGSTLHLFFENTVLGANDITWDYCEYGDEVVHAAITDVEDDIETITRVSPCCGNEQITATHYGQGSVNVMPFDGTAFDEDDYVMFVNRTEGGGNFWKGHFKEILMAVSDDGVNWTYPGFSEGDDCDDAGTLNPIIVQSNDVSIFEVNVVSDGDVMWGVFRYGDLDKYDGVYTGVGRLRIVQDETRASKLRVDILNTSDEWHAVAEDGTFNLTEENAGICPSECIKNVWNGARPSSIYDTGSGYEVWAESGGTATLGCDDDVDGGHTFIYKSITADATAALGASQTVSSSLPSFPLPTKNNNGRSFPYRVDFDGDELVFFSSSDRACYVHGQGTNPSWPAYTPLLGMDIEVVSLNSTIEPNDCDPSNTVACLHDDRFKVEVESTNGGLDYTVMPFGDENVAFSGNNPDFVEASVKIMGPISNYWWVFYGSLTNIKGDLTYTVTDTTDDSYETYSNSAFCGGIDLAAFYEPGRGVYEPSSSPGGYEPPSFPDDGDYSNVARFEAGPSDPAKYAKCVEDSTTLCFLNGRIKVKLYSAPSYRDVATRWGSSSGSFVFGDSELMEVPVKVIDGGYYIWVFWGSMTNTDFILQTWDMSTHPDELNLYYSNLYNDFCGGADTSAYVK